MAREQRNVHIKVTSNVASVNKDVTKASTGAKGLKGALMGVGRAASIASGGIRAMTMALLTSGVGAIVVALGAFVGIVTAAIREASEFSKSLSGLQAVLGANKDEMGAFSKQAKQLGATTAFTANQVLELQTEFAKLGFTRDEILNVTQATLDLAAAAGTDLANAAMVAGSTLRGFGLESEETARVADVMAKSFASSAMDITTFQESMKLVAPIAKTVKVDIELATAALSVLADSGIKGSMAGTQLRRVLTDLAMKTGKNFQDSLVLTKERLDATTSDAEKLAIAKELVGQRAASTLLILAENQEKLQDLEEAYDGAEGAASEMAEVRLDNLAGDVTLLKSAWSGLLLEIEDGEGMLTSIARNGVGFLTKSLNMATEASEFLAFGMRRSFESLAYAVFFFIKKMTTRIQGFLANAILMGAKAANSIRGLYGGSQTDIKSMEKRAKKFSKKLEIIDEAQKKKSAERGEFWDAWEKEKEVINTKKTNARLRKLMEDFVEDDNPEDDDKEAAARRKRQMEARMKFKRELQKKEEDFDDKTEVQRIDREKERALAELDKLGFNTKEKNELVEKINNFYKEKREEQETIDKEKADEKAKEAKEKEDKETQRKEEEIEKLRKQELQAQLDVFDNAARIAGEETKLGKAMLVMKQLLLAKELVMNAKNTIMKAKMAAAESGQQVTLGFSKAAATLNPTVIAGYAVTAAGIISSIANAFKASKEAASAAGVSGGGLSNVQSNAPTFNVVGQQSAGEQAIGSRLEALADNPIKAYVVESEVTNAQQMSSQVESNASIG